MISDEPQKAENAIAREVDEILNRWRSKVLSVALVLMSIALAPGLLAVIIVDVFRISWPVKILVLTLYLIMLLTALRPRWDFRRRAVILYLLFLAFSAIQILKTQLPGSGRITLVMLPLFMMILVGTRVGWLTAGVSVAWFGLFSAATYSDAIVSWLGLEAVVITPRFWALQGMRLIASLLFLMFINSRFQALQRSTMIAERRSLRRLEQESAERARLETEILRVNEEEKLRLGSELHDGLCQNLTAALLHCTVVENRLTQQRQSEADSVTRLRTMIEESIGLAYDVAKGLNPVDLDPESLVSALQRLISNVQNTSGIQCDFVCKSPISIRTQETALHLYRIAQEAVANAVKHAQGSRITVELADTDLDIVLKVQDDGVGKFGEKPGKIGGIGKQIMAYRASALGGALSITESPAGGTIVTCRIPKIRA